jgi:CRP-like cAMP-binding protein
MKEGEKPGSVMFLMSGALRAINAQGLNVLRSEAGTSFGEMSFLSKKPRTATVLAETPSEVIELTASGLTHLISKRPDLGVVVLQAFSKVALERAA